MDKTILKEGCVRDLIYSDSPPPPHLHPPALLRDRSKAFVAVVTIGEETYEGPRALHEETAKRGAYTKALDTLGVSYVRWHA